MKIECSSYTNIGSRTHNEDALCVESAKDGILLAVADGLGGYQGGEVASKVAIDVLKQEFHQNPLQFDLSRAISTANFQILEQQKKTGLRMKSTVSAAWVGIKKTVFAHVGDSRIYAFQNGRISFQTVDHSASQMAVFLGEIDSSEIRNHPDRNILTCTLGASPELKIDTTVIENEKYDALLLCTDGFWEYVLEEEMIRFLLSSQQSSCWISKMREAMTRRVKQGQDNNSAITMVKRGE